MTEAVSIVVLTGDGPEHRYVTNVICEHFPVSAVFVLSEPSRRPAAFFRHGLSAFLDKFFWRIFLLSINDEKARSQALLRVLGNRSREFAEPHKLIRMEGNDTVGLARTVARFHPQVIAVYGTGKISDEVLVHAGKVALNMHTGLSPRYRGTACAFWPIVANDPAGIGATVHECTSQMDGGKIYFAESARLFGDDDLHAIFARAVKVGAKGYVDVLHALFSNRLTAHNQDLSIGREYRGYMRGIRAEIRARYNLARMRLAWDAEEPDKKTGSV